MSDGIKEGEKGFKKKAEAPESLIGVLRERLRGYVIPELDRGAQSDPDFFEWLTQSSK